MVTSRSLHPPGLAVSKVDYSFARGDGGTCSGLLSGGSCPKNSFYESFVLMIDIRMSWVLFGLYLVFASVFYYCVGSTVEGFSTLVSILKYLHTSVTISKKICFCNDK